MEIKVSKNDQGSRWGCHNMATLFAITAVIFCYKRVRIRLVQYNVACVFSLCVYWSWTYYPNTIRMFHFSWNWIPSEIEIEITSALNSLTHYLQYMESPMDLSHSLSLKFHLHPSFIPFAVKEWWIHLWILYIVDSSSYLTNIYLYCMVSCKMAPRLCFHEQIVQNRKHAAHSLFSLYIASWSTSAFSSILVRAFSKTSVW